MKKILVLSIAVVILISACGTSRIMAKSGKTLGTAWELESIEGFQSEALEREVTLRFTDASHVSGNAGCNTFGGEYVRKGNKLKISKIISTRMACTPGMATEQAYLKALEKTTMMEILDGKLILLHGKEKLATLRAAPMEEKK